MTYFLLAAVILGIDQLTKFLVEKKVRAGERIPLVQNKLYITNIKNKGAAMGIMKENQRLLMLAGSVIMFFQIVVFTRLVTETKDRSAKIASAFLVGGGLGNMTDRAIKKQVTDFIGVDKSSAPIFNLADVFVLLGVIIITVKAFLKKE